MCVCERDIERERKLEEREREWPFWHEGNNEEEFRYLLPFFHRRAVASHPTPILRRVPSLCLFLNLSVTLLSPKLRLCQCRLAADYRCNHSHFR